MRGAQPSDGFGDAKAHLYWYVPPDIRETLNLRDAEPAEIRNTTPLPNFRPLRERLQKSPIVMPYYSSASAGFGH